MTKFLKRISLVGLLLSTSCSYSNQNFDEGFIRTTYDSSKMKNDESPVSNTVVVNAGEELVNKIEPNTTTILNCNVNEPKLDVPFQASVILVPGYTITLGNTQNNTNINN